MVAAKRLLLIAASVSASLVATLLVLNLSLGNKLIEKRPRIGYSIDDPPFLRAIGSVLSPPLVEGNRVRALLNGDQIFPAMLDAIRGAQRTITLETYICWSGSIGREFAEALSERAQRGVRVHVLLDWIGGNLDDTQLERMRREGVEIRRCNLPRLTHLGVAALSGSRAEGWRPVGLDEGQMQPA